MVLGAKALLYHSLMEGLETGLSLGARVVVGCREAVERSPGQDALSQHLARTKEDTND